MTVSFLDLPRPVQANWSEVGDSASYGSYAYNVNGLPHAVVSPRQDGLFDADLSLPWGLPNEDFEVTLREPRPTFEDVQRAVGMLARSTWNLEH